QRRHVAAACAAPRAAPEQHQPIEQLARLRDTAAGREGPRGAEADAPPLEVVLDVAELLRRGALQDGDPLPRDALAARIAASREARKSSGPTESAAIVRSWKKRWMMPVASST